MQEILKDLQSVGVHHNRMVMSDGTTNIMEKEGSLYLIDFAWSTVGRSIDCATKFRNPSNKEIFNDSQIISYIDNNFGTFKKYMNPTRQVGSQSETPNIVKEKNIIKVTGYQTYDLNLDTKEIVFVHKIQKFKYIQNVLLNLSSACNTLVDMGCSGGEISFIAQHMGYTRVDSLDHDSEYISTVKKLVEYQGLEKVVFPKVFDFGDPLREADVLVCGAIIHWVFSLTANFGDFNAIMKYLFGGVGKFLLIEWVDRNDVAIRSFHHLDRNNNPTKEEYNVENFERALQKYGTILSSKAVDGSTRVMYLVEKKVLSEN